MLNVAVIGIGYWGPNIVRNFIAHPRASVKICADLKPDRCAYINRLYPSLQTTADYREILKDNKIDLVAICTPVNVHYEIARAALESGKHILIEKPMTASSRQAEELISLAEKKKRKIFVDHTFIFTGAVKKMKELIVSGDLGDLYYFDSVRVNLGLFQHDVNVIWDLAPHDISIMQYLLGQAPQSVITTGIDHLGNGLEDLAYMTMYFSGNLIAHVHINWLSPVKIRQTLLAGSRKMIVWDDNQPSDKLRIYDKGIDVIRTEDEIYNTLIQYRTGDMYSPRLESTEALAAEVDQIVTCLEEDRPPLVGGKEGLLVVRILEAAQHSVKNQGKSINI